MTTKEQAFKANMAELRRDAALGWPSVLDKILEALFMGNNIHDYVFRGLFSTNTFFTSSAVSDARLSSYFTEREPWRSVLVRCFSDPATCSVLLADSLSTDGHKALSAATSLSEYVTSIDERFGSQDTSGKSANALDALSALGNSSPDLIGLSSSAPYLSIDGVYIPSLIDIFAAKKGSVSHLPHLDADAVTWVATKSKHSGYTPSLADVASMCGVAPDLAALADLAKTADATISGNGRVVPLLSLFRSAIAAIVALRRPLTNQSVVTVDEAIAKSMNGISSEYVGAHVGFGGHEAAGSSAPDQFCPTGDPRYGDDSASYDDDDEEMSADVARDILSFLTTPK